MGDLSADTSLIPIGGGRFSARLSREWEIWGPMGGYVAAVALRAAGAESPFDKPATFYCHYLGVADFDEIDVEVVALRAGRKALSQRVSIAQRGREVLEATVWSTGSTDGLEHDETAAPEVPSPGSLLSRDELDPNRRPPFPFWDNLEQKPVQQGPGTWPPPEPLPAVWQSWCRFRPVATFANDLWLDAARYVVLLDVQSWPAAVRPHAWREPLDYIAPSLDLYVAFHRPAAGDAWLLADGHAPLSTGGLFGWTGRIWTRSGSLVASGAGQAIYRRMP